MIVFQTADPLHYRIMLEATSRTAIEFCRRHGHRYESYLGIKRGVHPWQASFNRILQYREIMDRGHRGWAIHLDADAYIQDLDFDLATYLADKSDRAAVLIPSGASDEPWNINSGVSLINLGHPLGRKLADAWLDKFMALSDDFLAKTTYWPDDNNDQYMLYCILRDDEVIRNAVHYENPALINSAHASFIRQSLRAYIPDQAERTRALQLAIDELMGSADQDDLKSQLAPVLVAASYRAVLNRDPDPSGLVGYADRIREVGIERGIQHVVAHLLASEEYATKRPRG